MKIYHIALLAPGEPNTAIGRAFKEVSEYLELDWVKYTREHGKANLRLKIESDVDQFKPDLVFMQLQTPGIVDSSLADYMSAGATVFNWTGDVRKDLTWYVNLADHVDLTLFTNMTDVKTLRGLGKKSEYLQIGFDDEIYKPEGSIGFFYPEIVFLGNNYLGNNMNFPGSKERADMVEYLKKMYGNRFGVYGNGWPGTKHLNPQEEAECYRSCKIAINQNHFEYERFSSDRMLRIMGSGAFCLSKYFEGIWEEYTPASNIAVWYNFEDLKRIIDVALQDDLIKELSRTTIAVAGCKLVRENYTWKQRVQQIIKLYELDKANQRPQD